MLAATNSEGVTFEKKIDLSLGEIIKILCDKMHLPYNDMNLPCNDMNLNSRK